tara:strand:- start:27388 stop:27900 length:513 start_codon:yes stop_codon:yes gene_type:complete
MSYRTTSNQTGDLSEQIFYTEMIRKGWMVLTPSSRDAIYDFVIDMAEDGFMKVQVKTLRGNTISKFIDRSSSTVSTNGKVRNSTDYAAHGIDWLVAVDVEKSECHYYSLSLYSSISGKTINVKNHPSQEFPVNGNVLSNKPKSNTPKKVESANTLNGFITRTEESRKCVD